MMFDDSENVQRLAKETIIGPAERCPFKSGKDQCSRSKDHDGNCIFSLDYSHPKKMSPSEPTSQKGDQRHVWKENGIIIDTAHPFPEKVCERCGAINWGGIEDGTCPVSILANEPTSQK